LKTTVNELAPRIEEVIFIKSTDNVASALEIFRNNKILALPVLDVMTNKYVAFIHMLDILAYVVDIYQYQTSTVALNIEEIIQDRFKSTPINSIIQRAVRNPWFSISDKASILEAIETMARFQLYQIAVYDFEGKFYSILTQSRIISWLANRKVSEFGDFASEPLEAFHVGFKPLVKVHKSRRVLDAFLQMDSIGITGVAIVNDVNEVVGNISISDLKDIGPTAENFKTLYLNCETFIQQRETGRDVPKLIWATRKSTIKEVLGQFRTHHIHRVYVIEPQTHIPVGVITTTDVISLFANALTLPR